MRVLSVNVGQPQVIQHSGEDVFTGIFKEAVTQPLMLRKTHLDGDGQADLDNHGGEDKAAYVYPYEHYATWQSELGRTDFRMGQFGENFTVEGLSEETVCIGDTYRLGQAVVQVTQPRVPCFKLGIRMNDPKIVKKFMNARRNGFYIRVLQEGLVAAGDTISLVDADSRQVSVSDAHFQLYFELDEAKIEKLLEIEALPRNWKAAYKRRLNSANRD